MDSLTGESSTSIYYHAWYAFLTAMTALHEALGWEWWKGDATGLAAKAYAGGTWSAFEEQDPNDIVPQGTWSYSSPDVQRKRSEFWEWWCQEAVPAAWKAQSLLDE